MLDLEALKQLVVFADYGTLTQAAKAMNLSQPTLTRTMKSLEDTFGVRLFIREKNKIELNETGRFAIDQVKNLLAEADEVVRVVRAFDRSKNTIRIESCAPAPLWVYLPDLHQKDPAKTIASELKDIEGIIDDVTNRNCEIGIIPYAIEADTIACKKLLTENLSVVLTKDHPALDARAESMTLSDLNGHNCLLRSQTGFWEALCRKKMPASRFLVQEDDFEFLELAKTSTLPFFITNLVDASEYVSSDRVVVPITDPEANVTYHLIERKPSG